MAEPFLYYRCTILLGPMDGPRLNRGAVGEQASDMLARDRGWTDFGDFANKPANASGIDRVYLDPATGRYDGGPSQ